MILGTTRNSPVDIFEATTTAGARSTIVRFVQAMKTRGYIKNKTRERQVTSQEFIGKLKQGR